MIQRNESLLYALATVLRIIDTQLKHQHINHLTKEWAQLRTLIRCAQQSVSEGEGIDKKALVKTMMVITNKIDIELIGIESGLHGIKNIATLSAANLAEIAHKQQLKRELRILIHTIAQSAIHAKHTDFSDIVAMLQTDPQDV